MRTAAPEATPTTPFGGPVGVEARTGPAAMRTTPFGGPVGVEARTGVEWSEVRRPWGVRHRSCGEREPNARPVIRCRGVDGEVTRTATP